MMTSFSNKENSIYEQQSGEPIAMAIPSESEELKQAVNKSCETLPYFRKAFIAQKYPLNCYYLKTYIPDKDEDKGIHLWVLVLKLHKDGYICKPFEIPQDFNGLSINDTFLLKDNTIEDWMIRVSGDLYGGYTIRLMRAHMTQNEQIKFDQFIDVNKYSDQMP